MINFSDAKWAVTRRTIGPTSKQIDPEFMRQAEERGSFVRLPDVKKLGTLLRPSSRTTTPTNF
jgi:hypothetical protein